MNLVINKQKVFFVELNRGLGTKCKGKTEKKREDHYKNFILFLTKKIIIVIAMSINIKSEQNDMMQQYLTMQQNIT